MKLTESLSAGERRLVLAACIAAACVASMSVSFNFLLEPMEDTFQPTDAQMSVLRQAPSIAALLMVFPAGALGTRLGAKRFMVVSALTFSAGCLLVAVSPAIEVATLGFLVANVGRTGMFIVGLGYMAAVVTSKDGRAAAFAFFYMVIPVVSIVMPVLAGVLSDGVGWRWVAVTCALLGLVGSAVVARYVPRTPPSGGVGEMWTLALAGAILALAVYALDGVRGYGILSSQVMIPLALAVLAAAILAILMRRMEQPSLDLTPLRHGGFSLLLIVLMLFGFANLWFYTTMALEYIYGLSILQAAIAMIPAQVTALAGAALAGRLIQRAGIPRAGLIFIVAVGLLLWASMLVGPGAPVWLPIVIVSAYAVAAVGAGVPLTNAIMNTAPPRSEGSASAFRGAASNLGNALSVALMTAIVAFAVTTVISGQSTAEGIPVSSTEATQVLQALDHGASVDTVAAQYSLPDSDVEGLSSIQQDALYVGFRVQGLVGGAVTIVLAVGFFVVARREERLSGQGAG